MNVALRCCWCQSEAVNVIQGYSCCAIHQSYMQLCPEYQVTEPMPPIAHPRGIA